MKSVGGRPSKFHRPRGGLAPAGGPLRVRGVRSVLDRRGLARYGQHEGRSRPGPTDRPGTRLAFMTEQPIRVLIIGAHPDDADIKAGGTAARWSERGHVVRLV